jgi:hypothetical protein
MSRAKKTCKHSECVALLLPTSPPFFCCLHAEVDACASYPCQAAGTGGASVCTDLPNPAPNSAAGRFCSCAKATSIYENDVTGCVDVDACVSWPCVQSGPGGAATCADTDAAANSTAGRSCTCANGGLYAEATGCPTVGECLVVVARAHSRAWHTITIGCNTPC